MVAPLIDAYWSTNSDTATAAMVSDAFKANTRGNYISAITAFRSEFTSITSQLKAWETEAAESFVTNSTPDAYLHLARQVEKRIYITLL